MTSRIHEYPLDTPARLAYSVRWLGAGIAAGGGAGFLLALGASITLNEAFIDIWYDVDLDPLSRSVIPLLFVSLAIGLLLFAVFDSVYKWLLGRQLARSAATTPDRIPPHWQRQVMTGSAPLTGAFGAIWTIVGLAALVALGFFAILGETSDDEVAFVGGVALGAVLLVAVLIATAVAIGAWGKRHWPALVEATGAAWNRTAVREAEAADRARRPRGEKIGPSGAARLLSAVSLRLLNVGIGTVMVGAAIGFLGVFLRQPCRRCEQRSYESFGEALIDNLALIGSAVTALGIVVLIVVGLAATGAGMLIDQGLRAGAEGVDAQRRPAGSMLQERLKARSLAESYSILLSSLGAVAATVALAIAANDFPVDAGIRDTTLVVGIALLAIALVLAYAGVGYNLRLRSLLRERWAPADVPVVKATRAKQ